MKKKRMGHLIDYQRELLGKYDRIIKSNDNHMRIQDNAIIRKDQEIEIYNNAAKALKETLEDTQEALSRSRNFVKILQSSQRRSIKDMAESLYTLFNQNKAYKKWEFLIEEEREHWMALIVEILSGEKLIIR